MTPTTSTDITTDLDAIRTWWNTPREPDTSFFARHFPIADTPYDQVTPDGIDNPYWEILRHLPSENSGILGDGITPYGFARGLSSTMYRTDLVTRFSWAIPTPADMAWLATTLDGRPLVEVGAGSGYWAWQASQVGVDVIAYEPHEPAANDYVDGPEYFPLERADAVTAARQHPDRALLMVWPSYEATWAADALRAYQGDLLVYVGEHWACCAEESFFELLDAEWDELGESPDHRTWWGIHCRMTAYRRSSSS
jgi:hypothetical protein